MAGAWLRAAAALWRLGRLGVGGSFPPDWGRGLPEKTRAWRLMMSKRAAELQSAKEAKWILKSLCSAEAGTSRPRRPSMPSLGSSE